MLNELSKYHKDWLNIAYNFLNSKQDAEDVVQDMYIKVHRYGIELDKVRYKDGINKYFFYQVIRNMCLDVVKNRYNTIEIENTYATSEESDKSLEALQILFSRIDEEVQTWKPYERDLFEIYMYSGLSLRDISKGTIKNQGERKEVKKAKLVHSNYKLNEKSVERGTSISVNNLFTTIKRCKERLKDKFSEDFQDYFNNDFDYL